LSAARKLGHAHSFAFVLNFACHIECAAGRAQYAQLLAEELVTLSNEQGFALWLGIGNIV
jgi:hypothetical protein